MFCLLADWKRWGGSWALRATAIAIGRPIAVVNNMPSIEVYLPTVANNRGIECHTLPSTSNSRVQPYGAYPRELFLPTTVLVHFNQRDGFVGDHFTALLRKKQRTAEELLAAAQAAKFLVATAELG